jgi:hypothetical protein
VGAELFHTDRHTDMKNLTVAFRNFANVPKKEPLLSTITRNYGYQFMLNDSLTCVCVCVRVEATSKWRKPLVGFYLAKNLPQLADGPTLWGGEGFASVANPIQVSLYRELTPILQLELKNYPRDKLVLRQSSLVIRTAITRSSGLHRGRDGPDYRAIRTAEGNFVV